MVTLSTQYKELDAVEPSGLPDKVETLTMPQIRAKYPDEWILVGNPDLGDPYMCGPIAKRLITGIVLYHSKDKRHIANNAKFVRQGYNSFTIIFTGEIPKNRRIWLRFVRVKQK